MNKTYEELLEYYENTSNRQIIADMYFIYQLEIERLNNIINELEKWLVREYKRYLNDTDNLVFSNVEVNDFNRVLNKLKELKEGK